MKNYQFRIKPEILLVVFVMLLGILLWYMETPTFSLDDGEYHISDFDKVKLTHLDRE